MKYFYVENRFVSNLILVIVLAAISIYSYALSNLLNRSFRQNDIIVLSNIDALVSESFVTSKDYNNTLISDEFKLVIAKVSLRSRNEGVLDLKSVYLNVGSSRYTPVKDYNSYIKDLGTVYNYEKLPKEYSDYLIVYKVDKNINLNNARLVFNDYIFDGNKNFTKQMKVKLDTINLDRKDIINTYQLSEEMLFDDIDFVKLNNFTINKIAVNPSLELNYLFCINKTNCTTSVEILKPRLNSYEKDILTIEGIFNFDFASFFLQYATIEYKDTKTKLITEIKPYKAKKENTYYFEIPKNKSEITKIIFNIRNYRFEYSM